MESLLFVASRRSAAEVFQSAVNSSDYEVAVATSQRRAVRMARRLGPDVIVVDSASGLGPLGGFVTNMRRVIDAPVVGIVPKVGDRLSGAAALLVRPYTAGQLESCMSHVLSTHPRTLTVGPVTLDVRCRELIAPHLNEPKALGPKLFGLLRYLMQNAGQVVPRTAIMKEVWDTTYMADTRTLDVHVRWLRQLIDPPDARKSQLMTVRGKGYLLLLAPPV